MALFRKNEFFPLGFEFNPPKRFFTICARTDTNFFFEIVPPLPLSLSLSQLSSSLFFFSFRRTRTFDLNLSDILVLLISFYSIVRTGCQNYGNLRLFFYQMISWTNMFNRLPFHIFLL